MQQARHCMITYVKKCRSFFFSENLRTRPWTQECDYGQLDLLRGTRSDNSEKKFYKFSGFTANKRSHRDSSNSEEPHH